MSLLAGLILFTGVLLYAVLGGADFGAGFWDLTAGGLGRGRRPRELIDASVSPIWEADHVWLIFSLVAAWTAFPIAFAAVMTTLYIPLGLAALGIVLRGCGFAFRKVVVRTDEQRIASVAFESSSIITPFFLGAVLGALASGAVPTAGRGDALGTWLGPTALLTGVLAVAVCATLAAVELVMYARLQADSELEGYFRRRARASAVVTLVLSLAGLTVLASDAHRVYARLLGPAVPFVALAAFSGLAAVLTLRSHQPRIARGLAQLSVASIVVGGGVAQYPYLLGTHLSLDQAAAPRATLVSVAVVFAVAALLCLPSLALLYVLHHRGRLTEP